MPTPTASGLTAEGFVDLKGHLLQSPAMEKSRPNLLDPDFEPTDEQLHELTAAALRDVRRRAAMAAGTSPEIVPVGRLFDTSDTVDVEPVLGSRG